MNPLPLPFFHTYNVYSVKGRVINRRRGGGGGVHIIVALFMDKTSDSCVYVYIATVHRMFRQVPYYHSAGRLSVPHAAMVTDLLPLPSKLLNNSTQPNSFPLQTTEVSSLCSDHVN